MVPESIIHYRTRTHPCSVSGTNYRGPFLPRVYCPRPRSAYISPTSSHAIGGCDFGQDRSIPNLKRKSEGLIREVFEEEKTILGPFTTAVPFFWRTSCLEVDWVCPRNGTAVFPERAGEGVFFFLLIVRDRGGSILKSKKNTKNLLISGLGKGCVNSSLSLFFSFTLGLTLFGLMSRFGGEITRNLSTLSPKRDCVLKRLKLLWRPQQQWLVNLVISINHFGAS